MMNTLSLGITWYNEPREVTILTMSLNYVFSSIFIVEMIMKMIGFGIRPYFKDSWNQFDFIVVILTIVAEIVA